MITPFDNPPARAIEAAQAAAILSPCYKSKRGAVLFWADALTFDMPMVREVTAHHNGPPWPWMCGGPSSDCAESCGKTCMHAEGRTIHSALKAGLHRMRGDLNDQMLCHSGNYDMLHVKVVAGELVAGGPPSCLQCSTQILEFGCAGMWLFEISSGWHRYTAEEFHAATMVNHGLASASLRKAR